MYPGEMVLARANRTHSTASDLPVCWISTRHVARMYPDGSLTEVDDSRFGGIVCRLQLRNVDNMTAHGSSGHEAAVGEVVQLLAVDVSALLLLSPPVSCRRLGAVEGAVQINVDYTRVVIQRAVDHGALGPGNTGIGDENIQSAIKVLHNLIDGRLHGICVGDLDLVSLGWGGVSKVYLATGGGGVWELRTLDAVLGGNLGRPLVATAVGTPPQGDVGTGFSQAMGHGQTDARTGTCNNGRLALEGEHAQQAGVGGSDSVLVDEESILYRTGSHGGCRVKAEIKFKARKEG